ncbi:ATP-dependent DNA ligase [Agromyces archimandritae]|uniref:DNA ligase (ATP) n=1 Tax=Agromyces archimandritae TaxID=2781962 RepID=A0A975FJB9_9MICO|nr:ATP-dependent DNA ligase [Agromyces archimandritae]QTX03573.1 ATP-dependent DNA ligase [Agromyces archimandritae]
MAAVQGGPRLVDVDGRHLRLTNLDKVMYPETGTTKGEVISYYAEIAAVMLPHVAGRPVTQKRWVHGVGTADEPQQPFFEKAIEASAPEWVRRGVIHHSDGPKTYPVAGDRATLVWLAQQAALELHVPQWRFGPDGEPGTPDRLVLDLDPGEGMGLAECAEVARLARPILDGMGLDPVPVTSGSKGIHLYARLDGSWTSAHVSEVAKELARALEADHPELIVSKMIRAIRAGRVFIDWSQNNAKKTTIAPYSLRGRLRPTVAAPRTWRELASPKLRHLEFGEVLSRVDARGDPLAAVSAGAGPLAPYLSMRTAGVTPEPMPSSPGAAGGGAPGFVIQEHHARRLHYDFRLERDGVLKSWAVPKGIPADPAENHLAVEVEDHPLEYGSFEGTIPTGEYGAGTVHIWDSGTYDTEKWRDDEIIVTLHGRTGGPLGDARFALIRTSAGAKPQWLLHRTKEQPGAGAARSTRGGGASGKSGDTLGLDAAGRRVGASPRRSGAGAGAASGGAGRGGRPAASTAGTRVPAVGHRPMLAKAATLAELRGREWALEYKWDGIRALTRLAGGRVRAITRNGNDVTAAYPELAALAEVLDADGVVDGEIVAVDAAGHPDFGLLQQRMNLARPGDVERVRRTVPVRYYLFDVLEIAGSEVTALPYTERRARLEALVARTDGVIAVPQQAGGSPRAAFEEAARLGLEGIVAKNPASPYRDGQRSGEWLKIKRTRTQEVVIGGYRPGRGGRSGRIGSLLVGIPGADGLEFAGRVGTGFSERELDRLGGLLEPLVRGSSPFVQVPRAEASDAVWIEPRHVGEIEFSGWTRTGSARQPSWRGLRGDKSPDEVVRES